jgi:hypothetical protein
MAVVMPVSTTTSGGMGTPGFTSVWNSPNTWPPWTLTAPISVMASLLLAPVVSRSTTQKVTSLRGGPTSSRAG